MNASFGPASSISTPSSAAFPETALPFITYYVALPILRNEEGDWMAGEAAEAQNPAGAKTRAMGLAKLHGGAVAFSRTGDPQSGEFDDAVVIARFGTVPEDLAEFMG